jgi:TPR repeat protein
MADVLVSASTHDRDTAERLSRLFEARGLSVDWMPLDPVEPGNRAGIVRRRANARVTLAVWSMHSIQDPQVLEDAREALRRGSLLAARVEDLIAPPEFRATATANLTDWDGDASHIQAGRLLTETAKLLERTSTRPALALATARLNRPRGPGGATAAALRPTAQLGAAPAWPDAIAKASRPAASVTPEIKAATAPAALQKPEIQSEPAIAKTAEPAPAPEKLEAAASVVTEALPLTPAAVKTISDGAEDKLEPQPAAVMFAGEAANDALPLRPVHVTVSEPEPAEPTYQTFTFEPEPKPQSEPAPEPESAAAPEPAAAPALRVDGQARVETPAPAWPEEEKRAPKPALTRTPFLREPRERTQRDDRNHYLAMLIGGVVSIAFLALWFQQRPQDFTAPSATKPVIEASVQRSAAADETSAPAIAPEPATPAPDVAPEIDIASDLPVIQLSPILPQVEPAAPSTHALDAPAAPPVFAQAPAADAPLIAQSAPAAAAKATAIDPEPAIKAKAQAFAEAPRAVRAPEPAKAKAAAPSLRARRLAEVGRALDARAAAPPVSFSSPTIAALAGAPTAAAPVALASSIFDRDSSHTALRLAQGGLVFHLPGLAPSMLGAWTPGPDAPAPTLTIPVTDAEWNAAPARRLAQTALSTGDYRDHLAKAQAGERRAMVTLGLMRQTGIGEAQDDARAFAWLRRAALAGDARALSEIGAYYAAGIGAARDDDRALRNFDRSAMLGAASGKNAIGWALATGRGLPSDAAKARLAFEAAAEAGDPLAALNLGRMQADGLGGAMDLEAARRSYSTAADQGFAPAQYALAVLLLLDLPPGADDVNIRARTQAETLAALRVQQAAAQGYPPAQELLGALYLNGIGVMKDPAMARAWLDRIPQS